MKTCTIDVVTRRISAPRTRALVLWQFVMAMWFISSASPGLASEPLTVAVAKQSAPQLGSQQVLVHGHFWWGKEGSIIYDSGHKATMIVEYSPVFNAKYPGLEIVHLARQGKFATVTGRLRIDRKRGVTLVADDIAFADK